MYKITFQQLGIFFTIAQRLNITETANVMYISQSSLSKTIHRLEKALGLQLFLRNNRGLMLTKEGEYLYSNLRGPYDTMCNNILNAKSMQEAKTLRIGYPSTYDSSEDYDKLKKLIDDFAVRHPEIELVELLYDFSQLKNVLAFGEVDVAFSHDFIEIDSPYISRKNVCRSRMCLAMSAHHPLAAFNSTNEFDISALTEEVFYSTAFVNEEDARENDRIKTLERLNRFKIVPKDIRFIANFQSLMHAVRQGKGMCLCGYFPKMPGHEDIKFIELGPLEYSPFLTAAWRTKDMSKHLCEFIQMFPDNPDEISVFNERQII